MYEIIYYKIWINLYFFFFDNNIKNMFLNENMDLKCFVICYILFKNCYCFCDFIKGKFKNKK